MSVAPLVTRWQVQGQLSHVIAGAECSSPQTSEALCVSIDKSQASSQPACGLSPKPAAQTLPLKK